MPTLRLRSAQKLVAIMPTKSTLTGSQTRTMSPLNGSTVTRPAAWHSCTSTTQSAHWKNSRAFAALKAKEDSAILLSSTCTGRKNRRGYLIWQWAAAVATGGGGRKKSPWTCWLHSMQRQRKRWQVARGCGDALALQSPRPVKSCCLKRGASPLLHRQLRFRSL